VKKTCPQCKREFGPADLKQPAMFKRQKWCGLPCYHASKKFTREEAADAFWSKVDKGGAGGCWLYTGYRQKFGHGWTTYGLAHRFSWELLVGPVPEGKFVLHKCDVPACVNPEHLYIGVRDDNARDMFQRGRSARGERSHTAKLTDKDVMEIRRLKGKFTAEELGARYGVTASNIYHVQSGVVWKHLPLSPQGESKK
jgi:hypothetical protein